LLYGLYCLPELKMTHHDDYMVTCWFNLIPWLFQTPKQINACFLMIQNCVCMCVSKLPYNYIIIN
jgi:hypothetical protein